MDTRRKPPKRVADSSRVRKRPLVRAACSNCRARKTACDAARPRCGQCSSRELDCSYTTQDADETRHMALRRENDNLKCELQKLQDYVSQLTSTPDANGADALLRLAELSDPDPATTSANNSSTILAQVHNSMAVYRLRQPLQFNYSTNLAPDAQAGLSSHYSKAYPQNLAFENPQSVARDLLGPSTPSRLDGILRTKLDVNSALARRPCLCDPRLHDLDITYWSNVPLPNNYAAAAISHYLQTEHPAIALFDACLFVGDLVCKRNNYCSRFLVNALLSHAMQAYEIVDPLAWHLHVRFYEEAKELWQAESCQDSFLNLAALRLMDYAGATGGFDLDARYFHQCTIEMAERLGLNDGSPPVNEPTGFARPSDDTSWKVHAAWGYFASTSISDLFYMRRLPKPPLSLPLPGTCGFHLPWYMGSTFTSVCELFVIASETLSHCSDAKTLGQVPLEVVVLAYAKLLVWVEGLPSCCARNDLNPHHVMTMHIYFHCLVILLVRPWMGKDLHFYSESIAWSPDGVFHASISQLKRILILYQLNYPESRYHAWWNPAMIYVSHAVLTSKTDPEWRFYFLLCLKAYRDLSVAYPFATIGYRATLTMAMAEGKLSARKARDLLRQLFHGQGRENIRDTDKSRVYMDLNKIQNIDEGGDAERLADDFEKLAVVKEFTNL